MSNQLTFEFYNDEYADLDFTKGNDFNFIAHWENELRRKGLQMYEIAQMEMMHPEMLRRAGMI